MAFALSVPTTMALTFQAAISPISMAGVSSSSEMFLQPPLEVCSTKTQILPSPFSAAVRSALGSEALAFLPSRPSCFRYSTSFSAFSAGLPLSMRIAFLPVGGTKLRTTLVAEPFRPISLIFRQGDRSSKVSRGISTSSAFSKRSWMEERRNASPVMA